MGRGVILVGTLFLSLSMGWAQTGAVRIHVMDGNGSPIRGATVMLFDPWNRTVGNSPTNKAGDVLWRHLSFGEWRFLVIARGFAADVFAVNVCESPEQTIRTKLPMAPPEKNINLITVEATAALIDLPPMPYCDVLDLPQPTKVRRN